MDKLLIKRGSKRALEQLDPLQVGELFLAKDEERLYIGGPRGNISLPTQKDLDEKATKMELQQVSLAYKESYDTLDDLKNAYPNGDVYNHVVLADGMIYTYVNGEWISTGVEANGAIEFMKAYEDLKVLKIGGRNLLRNTGDFKDLTYWSLIKSTNQQGLVEIVDDSVRGKVLHVTKPNHDDRGWWVLLNSYYLYRPEKFIIGKEYTLSLDIKASVAMTVTINFRDKNRLNPVTIDLTQSISTPNTWNRYTFTFKATATGNEPHLYITIGSSIGELWLDNVKLEEGNKATDWTPAPEDINAHPFVAELAETVFRSKQNEERIRNLEEKLISN